MTEPRSGSPAESFSRVFSGSIPDYSINYVTVAEAHSSEELESVDFRDSH